MIQGANLGYPAIVVLVVVAIIRGDIVPGKTYDKLERECEFWRQTALQSLEVNERAVSAAEVTATVVGALPHVPSENQPSSSSNPEETKS